MIGTNIYFVNTKKLASLIKRCRYSFVGYVVLLAWLSLWQLFDKLKFKNQVCYHKITEVLPP